jgi:hypothetical protein
VPVGGEKEAQTIEPPTAGAAEASPVEQQASTAGHPRPSGES